MTLQKDIQTIKKKRLFIFDLDGTIYLDGVLFPSSLDLLNHISTNLGKYVFFTNNSSRSSSDYVEKIKMLGITCDDTNIATSTQATIDYIKRFHPNKRFYVVGTVSMIQELDQGGVDVTDAYSPLVDGVILGYDTELTYQKLTDATRLLNLGKLYLATHPDMVCPTEYGFAPDCGSFALMLEIATKRKPIILGKPERTIIDLILFKTGYSAEETILIGDRMYTDIACGNHAGIDTLLVLSGETKLDDLGNSSESPSFIMSDIGELFNLLKS